MELRYYVGDTPNFGDDLNDFIWKKILPPGFIDNDSSEIFLGIGSIIGPHHPAGVMKHVVGSGYGGYNGIVDVHDGWWNFIFVRGPRTAATLKLPPEKAICDGAVLLATCDELPPPAPGIKVAFMPHFQSLPRGYWERVCEVAGIRLIDPRGDVEQVLSEIRGADLLICEAMHGAIVADTLRTPWIAARPIHPEHHMKWYDWAEALEIDLHPHSLLPSSLLEAFIRWTKGKRYYDGRVRQWLRNPLTIPIDTGLIHLSAHRLQSLARLEPQLSNDTVLRRAASRAREAADSFVASRA